MKKKIISLALVVAMIAIMLTSFTMAYFTESEQATNEFAVGSVEIDLWETVGHTDGANHVVAAEKELGWNSDVATTYKYENIQPGDTLKKVVTIENTGKSAAYVALAIKHEGYKTFNLNIDDHYENKTKEEWNKMGIELPEGTSYSNNTVMQKIIDDIFSGDGWNELMYNKNDYQIRYYPSKVSTASQTGAKDYAANPASAAELIAVDYTVQQGTGGNACGYKSNMFSTTRFMDNGTYLLSKDEVYDTLENNDRLWVYYLYLPANTSYKLDLTMTCPTYITSDNIAAFEDMTIDVQAAAIQVAGFKSAKAAFTELIKTYDFSF